MIDVKRHTELKPIAKISRYPAPRVYIRQSHIKHGDAMDAMVMCLRSFGAGRDKGGGERGGLAVVVRSSSLHGSRFCRTDLTVNHSYQTERKHDPR